MEISETLWRFVGAWPDRPCDVRLDCHAKAPPSWMMQQLSGTVVDRRFIDGGFIGRWPFAIAVRTAGEDSRGRLDAVAAINQLAGWMRSQKPPNLGENRTCLQIEMVSYPARVAIQNDGAEDYQAVFAVTYKEVE